MNFIKKIFLASMLFLGASAFSQTTQSISIPNVFTPDADGINDFFIIRTVGYEALTCRIMNRYGSTVYVFEGLNGSWDGFTHAGDKVMPGVYYVNVEATDASGEVTQQHSVLTVVY